MLSLTLIAGHLIFGPNGWKRKGGSDVFWGKLVRFACCWDAIGKGQGIGTTARRQWWHFQGNTFIFTKVVIFMSRSNTKREKHLLLFYDISTNLLDKAALWIIYTVNMSGFQVIRRFLFKSLAWAGIYLLGYYDFSIAWLFTPLLLTVR